MIRDQTTTVVLSHVSITQEKNIGGRALKLMQMIIGVAVHGKQLVYNIALILEKASEKFGGI